MISLRLITSARLLFCAQRGVRSSAKGTGRPHGRLRLRQNTLMKHFGLSETVPLPESTGLMARKCLICPQISVPCFETKSSVLSFRTQPPSSTIPRERGHASLLHVRPLSDREARRRAAEMLQRVGLGTGCIRTLPALWRPAARVAIARALINPAFSCFCGRAHSNLDSPYE